MTTEDFLPQDPQAQLRRQSLADIAYQTLRKAIVAGQWAPGTLLRENELTEALSMSRTPIREAVRRLQADRFLQSGRSGGAVVPERGMKELIADYLIRAELEGLAAALAAPLIGDAQITELEAMTDEMFRLVQADDVQAYLDRNHEFHRLLVQASRCERLIDFHDVLSDSIRMVSRQEVAELGREDLLSALYGHRDVTRAFRDRDPESARTAVRDHVLTGVDWLREQVGSNERGA